MRPSASLLSLAAAACFASQAFAETVAYWHFNGLSIDPANTPGNGGVPLTIAADVGTGTLSLEGYGGTVDDFAGSTTNSQGGAPSGASLSLVAGSGTPFPGNGTYIELALDLTGFENPVITFATRGTASGFDNGVWSYSVGGGEFITLPDINTATTSTTFGLATVDLSEFDDLDEAEDVRLRYTVSGATSASGNNRIDNLLVSATPTGDDETPPTVISRVPAHNATDIPAANITQITFAFNENVVAVSGNIELRKLSDGSLVQSFAADPLAFEVFAIDNEVFLSDLAAPLEIDTTYYITIPEGTFEDLAGNPFAGFLDNQGWRFSTAGTPSVPSVVINKYYNSGAPNGAGDIIELLVIGDETPATSLDLRGMIVKDFSDDMGNDGGGKFEFSADPLWEAVPVGSLIVLSSDNTAEDIDSSDFLVKVGLTNTTYFTTHSSSFNIAGTDMVMIKAAGSGIAGTVGGIHVLAGGQAGSLFASFPGAKLIASSASGTGTGIVANNSTSTISDFIGEDATGSVALTSAQFGVANSSTNAAYIAALRGTDPSSGDGVATLANATAASPYANTGIFGRGLATQSAAVTINAYIPDVTLTDVTIEVPAELGAPSSATLSGPGAASALSSVAGQTITVSSASATASDALIVTIHGLSTPSPSLLTDTGNYPFTVSTRGASGALAPIAIPPVARVIVPIEVLRDVENENGVALDAGAVVAVEGVCTMGNFSTTNTQAFLQDETAGINVFNSTLLATPLERSRRYAILGSIIQFNGLTEIVPLSENQIVDLGPATEPAPQTVTIPALLADAEKLEGSLVTVANLTKVLGTWTNGQNVTLKDASNNEITIRIQPASTALPEPSYPLTVTGVLNQRDTSSPFTSGYEILPRDPDDLTEGTLSGYDAWSAANAGGQGANLDFDNDGVPNGVEYFFGETGSSFTANPQPGENGAVTWPRNPSAAVASFHVETSDNLVDWDPVEAPDPNLVITTTSVTYTLPPGAGKLFVRLVVTP